MSAKEKHQRPDDHARPYRPGMIEIPRAIEVRLSVLKAALGQAQSSADFSAVVMLISEGIREEIFRKVSFEYTGASAFVELGIATETGYDITIRTASNY